MKGRSERCTDYGTDKRWKDEGTDITDEYMGRQREGQMKGRKDKDRHIRFSLTNERSVRQMNRLWNRQKVKGRIYRRIYGQTKGKTDEGTHIQIFIQVEPNNQTGR